MKTINVHFENREFEKLKKHKKDQSWHDFILQLVDKEGNKQNDD